KYYGPTMNAFEAAENKGQAAVLQKELEELFNSQNKSQDATAIPATFLRATCAVENAAANVAPAASALAWLFLLALLLLSGRAGAITSTSRLRMLPSHLGMLASHLRIARHLIHRMGSASGASSSPGSFAGVHFGLVSPSGSLISGLELVPVCSSVTCFLACSCSLKITFGYLPRFVSTFSGLPRARALAIKVGCVPDFVFTFACTRSCRPDSLGAAFALPGTFALGE